MHGGGELLHAQALVAAVAALDEALQHLELAHAQAVFLAELAVEQTGGPGMPGEQVAPLGDQPCLLRGVEFSHPATVSQRQQLMR